MYAQVFKTSEAAHKAWATRNKGAAKDPIKEQYDIMRSQGLSHEKATALAPDIAKRVAAMSKPNAKYLGGKVGQTFTPGHTSKKRDPRDELGTIPRVLNSLLRQCN